MEILSRRNGSTNDFFTQTYQKLTEEGHGVPGLDYFLALRHWHELTASSFLPLELTV